MNKWTKSKYDFRADDFDNTSRQKYYHIMIFSSGLSNEFCKHRWKQESRAICFVDKKKYIY